MINTFSRKQRSPLGFQTEETTASRACTLADPARVHSNAPGPTLRHITTEAPSWPYDWPAEGGKQGPDHASPPYWQAPGQTIRGDCLAGPSSHPLPQDSHGSGHAGEDLLDPGSLATIFDLDDFHAECAGWFLQPGQTGFGSDSGYSSLLSAGGFPSETGKGKEVEGNPFAGF